MADVEYDMLSETERKRVWFISNLSRGFGLELVQQLLMRGDQVVVTAPNIDKMLDVFPVGEQGLLALSVDPHDTDHVTYAVKTAIAHFGRVDILVNNATAGILGAVEEVSDAEILKVMDSNLLASLRMTRAVLPHMRRQRTGRIVNMSTLAGVGEGAGWGAYSATKAAIEALSEALAIEVEPLGIGVTLLDPVPFRTDFPGESLIIAGKTIDDYYDTAGRTRRRHGVPLGAPLGQAHYYPSAGVASVITALTSKHPPQRLVLGHKGYYRALKRLEDLREEYMAWHDVSLAMDHIL